MCDSNIINGLSILVKHCCNEGTSSHRISVGNCREIVFSHTDTPISKNEFDDLIALGWEMEFYDYDCNKNPSGNKQFENYNHNIRWIAYI